ncbi:hypothetical protein M409DRAFT_65373 [Zasmidium cellare ATCC 36951]|uniref:dolichol kinase n=1 Tax=Zasmidium cellare ATCC 36951 TaxID=1080233 RepID=A0A6A6CP89_ZASCE|nr:uncharacterized protein M409DRAFT_65373 [Zasmidium cellare ATCC 36951]KAF2169087.1 hypothetical protein M409DRAFT_65373 [Zasmidium cellare ATCC 36951]
MSHALKPPDTDHESLTAEAGGELDDLRRQFSRTPRPYLLSHDGVENREDDEHARYERRTGSGDVREDWQRHSGQSSIAASESGTEADDERPDFIKALPPAQTRPRKGLKTGEQNEDALLTPSQLDEKEQSYFQRQSTDKDRKASTQEEEARKEREALNKRRVGEFVRRLSEVALMGVMLACVLCGKGVGRTAWNWRRELLSHVVTIVALIAAYPVKLSIVDTQATHSKLWERFRVPASFDPATVLYPPLLPVMVALSVAPNNPAVVLPNIILGLSSLPQRLFPRSSRLGGINALHWLIAIVPLIVSENTAWPSKIRPPQPYQIKMPNGLSPETLVSLYPLHHALLQPLHYLTTTSLLMSELHLLSAALTNLLLLASSPQTTILKACLWVGGVSLFVACGPVLHWNVTLARVPRWKLRRPGHTAEERKSLVDAVSDVINLQRAAGAFTTNTAAVDSDADEDEPQKSMKHRPSKSTSGWPRLDTTGLVMPSFNVNVFEPKSAIEPRQLAHSVLPDLVDPPQLRARRNTVPEREPPPAVPERQPSNKRKNKPIHHVLWCLQLTPEQATRRKWIYAGFTYLAIVTIGLIPIRGYIARKALYGQDPIGWAVSYLFSQIPFIRSIIEALHLQSWIPLPHAGTFNRLPLSLPLHIDAIRNTLGAANVRLLLIAYWVLVLLVGLLAVFSLTAFVEVDTRRKVFHGVMVAMLLPATFVDPCYCALALSLVLAIFLLLEAIRAGQVPPLGNAIGRFVAPYVDGRDLRGPVVVSHIFLLIGCAVPLWFSLASVPRTTAASTPWQDWDLQNNIVEVPMIAGVICVGMGDAAASLIGRRYGRHKWIWVGGKSIEGSAAFAAAVTLGLLFAKAWQVLGGWNDTNRTSLAGFWDIDHGILTIGVRWLAVLFKAVFCACGASFMEAVLTGANDNVVVPVALWLLVKGVRL